MDSDNGQSELVNEAKYTWKRLKNKAFRDAFFRHADANFLVSTMGGACPTWICPTRDWGIGRRLFTKSTYGTESARRAIQVLGGAHQLDFVDVGAHYGSVCIELVHSGLASRAVAIEADPANFRVLMANIYLNGLQDAISTHQCAASDQDFGSRSLVIYPESSGRNQITQKNSESTDRVISVGAKTLDTLLMPIMNSSLPSLLIQLDTQGHEPWVLMGAKGLMERSTPIILEFWPAGLTQTGGLDLLTQILLESPYKKFMDLRHGHHWIPLDPRSLGALIERYGDGNFTDILIT